MAIKYRSTPPRYKNLPLLTTILLSYIYYPPCRTSKWAPPSRLREFHVPLSRGDQSHSFPLATKYTLYVRGCAYNHKILIVTRPANVCANTCFMWNIQGFNFCFYPTFFPEAVKSTTHTVEQAN